MKALWDDIVAASFRNRVRITVYLLGRGSRIRGVLTLLCYALGFTIVGAFIVANLFL